MQWVEESMVDARWQWMDSMVQSRESLPIREATLSALALLEPFYAMLPFSPVLVRDIVRVKELLE
jgi:hypothetical protein